MTAGVMVGIFMLLSGVIEIVVFATTSGLLFGSGWLLLDGVLTVILSLFLLFNQWFTMMSLPFLFTLWLLFSGISRFVSAFDLRAFGVRGWGWILTIGIILMVAGFICMMDPWVSVAPYAGVGTAEKHIVRNHSYCSRYSLQRYVKYGGWISCAGVHIRSLDWLVRCGSFSRNRCRRKECTETLTPKRHIACL